MEPQLAQYEWALCDWVIEPLGPDDDEYDEPYIPGKVTYQDFKEFAERNGVPVESVQFVLDPRAFHIDYYLRGKKEMSPDLKAQAREYYNEAVARYEELVASYDELYQEYEQAHEKYLEDLRDYNIWKAKQEYKAKKRLKHIDL